MKKTLLIFLFCSLSLMAQNQWNVVWKMEQKPFMDPKVGSEMAIVKAGFDTDQDGWGEFLCAWTDLDKNYLLMYEASGDDQYELVWWFEYPIRANTFAGIAVGDIDNNGLIDIITTMPSVVNAESPNPPRLWVFEWNGVVGENKYGRYSGDVVSATSEWNFDLPANIDFRPYSLMIEDIDKDGVNELIAGVRQSDRGREVIVASVNGELSGFGYWEIEYNFAQSFGGSLYSVTTGDLDNDGKNEIYALIWNYFTMRIFECEGNAQYQIVTELDEIFKNDNIDYGALDGVRVADVNNDGVMEMYIAGTEPVNSVLIVTGVSDVSQISASDVKVLMNLPAINVAKLRAMYIADPDKDGNLSLMIAGEGNGQIFDIEYKGEGDPADPASWDVNIIFDIWEYSGIAPTDSPTLTPRFFYGHPAGDMDQDGKDEYAFINYSSDFAVWEDDVYLWLIEIDQSTGLRSDNSVIPGSFQLQQNYPNPFNPSTKISYQLPSEGFVSLKVYDVLGKEVAGLINDFQPAGLYEYNFTADEFNLSSGVYVYVLKTGNFIQSRKMMLMK